MSNAGTLDFYKPRDTTHARVHKFYNSECYCCMEKLMVRISHIIPAVWYYFKMMCRFLKIQQDILTRIFLLYIQVIASALRKDHSDPHRFEKISNIIK